MFKADTESAVDKLLKILLSKEDKDFDAICSALRVNGYEEIVARLEEKAKAKKSIVVAPRDQELLVKLEQAWSKPPKAESSLFPGRTEEHAFSGERYMSASARV